MAQRKESKRLDMLDTLKSFARESTKLLPKVNPIFTIQRIPFTGSIHGGLQEGMSIIISGRVLPKVDRFHVNLQCGSSQEANIALHFNPCYMDGKPYVVTNTLQHGKWVSEERNLSSPIPLGHIFTLQITVMEKSYKISVDGTHYMDYTHCIQFQQVDTIAVGGEVEVSTISFSAPVNVPYKQHISDGLKPGRTITIQGIVPCNATRFHVNLCHISGIALHYNPRFNEGTVVRNTKQYDKWFFWQWGSEERGGPMPFKRGLSFMLTVICKEDNYQTLVDGKKAHTYYYRFDNLESIKELEINGDVLLTSVIV
ncbi:galectin-9-like [Cyprinodon tularosa]|uniref:galectin-9-like n=1 Tax=Cyprinodon tularosa TaxID=77115 RepID=UPI0018E26E67|nr:galectin-9-like [Cyprinodon tularosa]